jgi:hypothetical protein
MQDLVPILDRTFYKERTNVDYNTPSILNSTAIGYNVLASNTIQLDLAITNVKLQEFMLVLVLKLGGVSSEYESRWNS